MVESGGIHKTSKILRLIQHRWCKLQHSTAQKGPQHRCWGPRMNEGAPARIRAPVGGYLKIHVIMKGPAFRWYFSGREGRLVGCGARLSHHASLDPKHPTFLRFDLPGIEFASPAVPRHRNPPARLLAGGFFAPKGIEKTKLTSPQKERNSDVQSRLLPSTQHEGRESAPSWTKPLRQLLPSHM